MSLAEIQKTIEALAPEEQEELRNWLDGYEPARERELSLSKTAIVIR
jgi:hypothetical protein